MPFQRHHILQAFQYQQCAEVLYLKLCSLAQRIGYTQCCPSSKPCISLMWTLWCEQTLRVPSNKLSHLVKTFCKLWCWLRVRWFWSAGTLLASTCSYLALRIHSCWGSFNQTLHHPLIWITCCWGQWACNCELQKNSFESLSGIPQFTHCRML